MHDEYRVDTKVGQVRLTLNDADHVYVCLGENTNRPDGFTIQINGRQYSGGLRMMRENGAWVPARDRTNPQRTPYSDRQAVHLNSTWDGKRFVEPTASAYTKVLDVVLPAVAQWLEANPNALTQAHIAALESKIKKAEENVQQKRDELSAAERELAQLSNELANTAVSRA